MGNTKGYIFLYSRPKKLLNQKIEIKQKQNSLIKQRFGIVSLNEPRKRRQSRHVGQRMGLGLKNDTRKIDASKIMEIGWVASFQRNFLGSVGGLGRVVLQFRPQFGAQD